MKGTGRFVRRWLIPAVIVSTAGVVGATFLVRGVDGSATPQGPQRPFSATSPWNTQISAAPAIDPLSAAMIAGVQSKPALYAGMHEFGIPIYQASSGTPTYSVKCSQTAWGPCPFDGKQVPIPDGARPHTGSDGAMVVVDQQMGVTYEFWRARHVNDGWSTTFGAINSLGGSGWGGAATGSGASRLGGVIRLAEIANGDIPHALALQSNNVCAGVFRAPALKTDGISTLPNCIPEGARLQLDPSIDLAKLKLTPAELAVGTAMQRYGGYLVDMSGSPLSVSFELDPSTPSSISPVYKKAGLRWDYDDMAGIPWGRLRVVR